MRRAGAIALGLALAGVAALPLACASAGGGYSFDSPYRQDIKTIAVPVFANSTFAHGVEGELTDAIIKEIHRTTPWRVTGLDRADTSLRGAVTDADLRKLTTNSESGLVESMSVQLTVSFEWKRTETGDVLLARRNFKAGDIFVPASRAGERLEFGQSASIDQLAREIVASLRSSW